jgi:hypothetical protein
MPGATDREAGTHHAKDGAHSRTRRRLRGLWRRLNATDGVLSSIDGAWACIRGVCDHHCGAYCATISAISGHLDRSRCALRASIGSCCACDGVWSAHLTPQLACHGVRRAGLSTINATVVLVYAKNGVPWADDRIFHATYSIEHAADDPNARHGLDLMARPRRVTRQRWRACRPRPPLTDS